MKSRFFTNFKPPTEGSKDNIIGVLLRHHSNEKSPGKLPGLSCSILSQGLGTGAGSDGR